MDVVYTLSSASAWNDNELRFSLRSICDNLKDLNQVWIIGHKPKWLTNVRHIPFPDCYKGNKDANLIQKLIRVCQEPDLSDQYVFNSDDQYLLQPVHSRELKNWCLGNMMTQTVDRPNRWHQRLLGLRDKLAEKGFPAFNYEAHIPYIHDKRQYPKALLQFDYGAGVGYTVNTPYFNVINDRHHVIEPYVRCRLTQPMDQTKIEQEMDEKLILNHNDPALNANLKQILKEKFPHPSPFEAN